MQQSNNSLILLERVILESLMRGEKNPSELQHDTGITLTCIESILEDFIQRDICFMTADGYRLSNQGKRWNEKSNFIDRKVEALEFFSTFFEQSINQRQGKLKMKKVWMDQCEQMLFMQLLDRVDDYIHRVQLRNRQQQKRGIKLGKLKEQVVVLWGNTFYGDLVNHSQTAHLSC